MADHIVRTFDTGYTPTSFKRDVDKMLALVAFEDTPFYTSMKKGKASTHGLVERLEDNLASAAVNAQIEGADVVTTAVDAPGTIDNRVQRFQKDIRISNDMEKTDKYARKSEINRIQNLKMKELARDMEYNMLNNTRATGTDAVAAKMDGLLQFAHADSTYDFGGTFADTNQIAEDILLDVLQAMWENGAKPDTILAPPTQKRKISKFTDSGRVTVNQNATEKQLTMIVNVLETDFGVVAVVPELFIEPEVDTTPDPDVLYDTLAIYDSRMIECKTFRPLERKELAQTGDSRKFYMTTSKTILPYSKKCVGKISKCTRVFA